MSRQSDVRTFHRQQAARELVEQGGRGGQFRDDRRVVTGALLTSADAAGVVNWDASVDSTIIRAHQHAANPPATQGARSNYKNLLAEPADHALGRSRGGLSTKIHQLVDGHGYPLVVLVGPGQAGDAPMFPHLMEHLSIARPGVGRPPQSDRHWLRALGDTP